MYRTSNEFQINPLVQQKNSTSLLLFLSLNKKNLTKSMKAHYNLSFYAATFYAAFISNNLWNSESYSPSALDWPSIFSRFRQMNHGTMDICNKFLWNGHVFFHELRPSLVFSHSIVNAIFSLHCKEFSL